MSGTKAQASEVARLLQQIREEYESAQLGFSGLAYGTVKHEFITQKMENMGKLQEELQTLVGDAAMELVVQQLSDFPGPHSPLVQ
jgi:hypothetical protein